MCVFVCLFICFVYNTTQRWTRRTIMKMSLTLLLITFDDKGTRKDIGRILKGVSILLTSKSEADGARENLVGLVIIRQHRHGTGTHFNGHGLGLTSLKVNTPREWGEKRENHTGNRGVVSWASPCTEHHPNDQIPMENEGILGECIQRWLHQPHTCQYSSHPPPTLNLSLPISL